MCVWMYECVCVCVSVYTCVCVCVCACLCVFSCLHACTFIYFSFLSMTAPAGVWMGSRCVWTMSLHIFLCVFTQIPPHSVLIECCVSAAIITLFWSLYPLSRFGYFWHHVTVQSGGLAPCQLSCENPGEGSLPIEQTHETP